MRLPVRYLVFQCPKKAVEALLAPKIQTITIDFDSDWAVGSGLETDPEADWIVKKEDIDWIFVFGLGVFDVKDCDLQEIYIFFHPLLGEGTLDEAEWSSWDWEYPWDLMQETSEALATLRIALTYYEPTLSREEFEEWKADRTSFHLYPDTVS